MTAWTRFTRGWLRVRFWLLLGLALGRAMVLHDWKLQSGAAAEHAQRVHKAWCRGRPGR